MSKILENYQAVIFLDASDIKPDYDTISLFMKEYKDMELLPSVHYEFSLEIPPKTIPRLLFSNQQGDFVIKFSSDRIDIVKKQQKESALELDKFCALLNKLTEKVFSNYGKQADRISLVSSMLLEKIDESELNAVYLKLFVPPTTYMKFHPYEWNWRSVSKIPSEAYGSQELINVITEIGRENFQIVKDEVLIIEPRIKIHLDINTDQENRKPRINFEHFNTYYKEFMKIHDNTLKEIKEFINEKIEK